MMKKRLSKTIWYGSEVDTEGNPIVPELAKGADDLEGLHHGELYLHEADDNLSLWARTLTNQVKPIGGLGGGGSLWKLMETESGEKFLFTEFNVVTQMGITSFADNKILDLPGIYDGLVIDNQTIVWEEIDGVKTLVAKGGGSGSGGSGEGGGLDSISTIGTGNAITSVSHDKENNSLVFNKGSEFVTTGSPSQEITSLKNFTGGLEVNGCELVYDSVNKYWKLTGDLIVTGGITSFADDTEFEPSTIMDALVLDGETLELQETVDSDGNVIKQLTVIGGLGTVKDVFITGDGNAFTGASIDEDGVMVFTRSKTFAEKSYLDNSFYTKEYINEELKKYVPIEGDCEIKGTKNFTGSLQVNGQPIVYDVEGGYWKLDGDLLVTGGITSFDDDTAFTPSTIMDALILDQSTLKIDENGQLTVIGGTGGGTGGVDEDAVKSIIESYNYTTQSSVKSIVEAYGYLTSSDLPTATTSVKGIASFNSTDFTVSSGKVSLAARVKIVSSLPSSSSRTTNTLYVIV